jgi:hypothetical protein
MSLLNEILGGKKNNPKELLLKELEQSEDFFKLLSEALREPSFQNDQSLNNLKYSAKQYIQDCNIEQLRVLVNILKKNKY